VESTDDSDAPAWLNGPMSSHRLIRRELDLATLAARERRLRLVIQILSARGAEYRDARQPTPDGLRQSIGNFGQQLGDVRRRQADLTAELRPVERERATPMRGTGRFSGQRARDYLPESS
jgi:hypothetical protein